MAAVLDRTLEAAIEYAGHGWLLVPIYGETNGVCECRKGAACDTPGKHPRIKSWQDNASCDEDVIAEWFDKWPQSNIGVLLGPKSGIVDVEYDSEEGKKTAEKILGDAVTASFKSTRGRHCLFKWQDWMPDMDSRSGKIDYMGLELRLGHRTRGFQSVLPPSSGRLWLPGHAVDDVGIADPPDGIEAIVSIGETKVEARNEFPKSESRIAIRSKDAIIEGADGRNKHLHAESCGLWRQWFNAYGPRVFTDDERYAEIYDLVWCKNVAKCRPQMDSDEFQKLFKSARDWVWKQTASEDGEDEKTRLTELGLEFREGEWWPGAWRVVCVRSDPMRVKLFAPFLSEPLTFDFEEFDSPKLVHLKVWKATGTVCLDKTPGYWASIWNGRKGSKDKEATEGIRSKLVRNPDFEDAPAEQKRFAVVAERLLSELARPKIIDGEKRTAPDKRGAPSQLEDGSIVFQFMYIWNTLAKSPDKLEISELSNLMHELNASTYRPKVDGKQLNLKRITRESLETLVEISQGRRAPSLHEK